MPKVSKSIAVMLGVIISVSFVSGYSFYILEGSARGFTVEKCIYWAIVTMSTVGYGDITPETEYGMFLALITIIAGLGVYGYVIGRLGSMIIEEGVMKVFGMDKCKYKGHIIICGWNDVARSAAMEIIKNGEKVAVITKDERATGGIKGIGAFAVVGDEKVSEVLKNANVEEAKSVIICLNSDSDTILTALAIRKVNPDIRIIADIKSEEMLELLKGQGLFENVVPHTHITGCLLASAAFEKNVAVFIEDISSSILGEYDVIEEKVPEKCWMVGRSYREVFEYFKDETNASVVAVVKGDKVLINPSNELQIEEGDSLIILGSEEELKNTKEILSVL